MNAPRRLGAVAWLGQLAAYALFVSAIGVFATAPSYRPLADDRALVRLSFSHASQRAVACRKLSPAEVAALAPNMRSAVDCPRERVPVRVELRLDDAPLYVATLVPTGLANDGAATAYQNFEVAAGSHRITARLRDSAREDGFDYESAVDVSLAPAEILVIDFDATSGGFEFR